MFAAECHIYTSRFGKYMHISYACLCKDWRVIFKQEVSEREREKAFHNRRQAGRAHWGTLTRDYRVTVSSLLTK